MWLLKIDARRFDSVNNGICMIARKLIKNLTTQNEFLFHKENQYDLIFRRFPKEFN